MLEDINLDFVTGYQFFAYEKNDGIQGAIRAESKSWTPFTISYRSQKNAESFLRRNGEFWSSRGVKLALFKDYMLIATVDVDKLVELPDVVPSAAVLTNQTVS